LRERQPGVRKQTHDDDGDKQPELQVRLLGLSMIFGLRRALDLPRDTPCYGKIFWQNRRALASKNLHRHAR